MNQPDTRFLPFFMRQPIYVVPEPEPLADRQAAIPELRRLGEGNKNILIIVQETHHEFLAPDNEALLKKILQAVSLSLEDVSVVNTESWEPYLQQEIPVERLLTTFPYQTCIILGNIPTPWAESSQFEKYQLREGTQGQAHLQADPLSVIQGDIQRKTQLWKCLQQLFLSA